MRVGEILTPRTVVTALNRSSSVAEVFNEYPTLPFGRLPVFGRNMDDIVGAVRRRDLLKAKAQDQDAGLVEHFMQEAQFIPETATVGNALQVRVLLATVVSHGIGLDILRVFYEQLDGVGGCLRGPQRRMHHGR